jgi:hypothetical protein
LGQPPLTFDKAVIAGETGPKSAMGGKQTPGEEFDQHPFQ